MEVKRKVVGPTLDYRTPDASSSPLQLLTCGLASIATVVLSAALVAVCFAFHTGLVELGVAYLCIIALSGIGTIVGLIGAVFGSRHRVLATIGFSINTAILVLAVRPLVNYG